MIKTILTILLLAIGFLHVGAQNKNVYIDALQLRKLKEIYDDCPMADTYFEIKLLLSKYSLQDDNSPNPFLSVEDFKPKHADALVSNKDSSVLATGQFGQIDKYLNWPTKQDYTVKKSIGNWQSSSIQAISNFLTDRFKQEAMQAGMNQLFKRITRGADSELINQLFPKTWKYINDLYGSGNKPYYSSDLQSVKQFALLDLETVPKNMLLNTSLVLPKLAEDSTKLVLLTTTFKIIKLSEENLAPIELIRQIASNSTESELGALLSSIHSLSRLAYASLDTIESDRWVDLKLLKNNAKTLKQKEELSYFYGLLLQELKHSKLFEIPNLKLYQTRKEFEHFIDLLLAFTPQLNQAQTFLEEKQFNLTTIENKVAYAHAITSVLKTFLKSSERIVSNLNLLDEEDSFAITDNYLHLYQAASSKEYSKLFPLFMLYFNEYTNQKRIIPFMFELTTLTNISDFSALLNSYTLPIGSSSIKRRSKLNLSLNGYVGISAGHEIAYGSQFNVSKSTFALSAPIGLSATYFGGAITSFLSIVDLGAVVNKKLGDDTAEESKLRIEQFFSPGLGMYYNLRNLPLSAGISYNYVPHLRNMSYIQNGQTVTELNRNVSRFSFSVLVDIPFFTLHHKDR